MSSSEIPASSAQMKKYERAIRQNMASAEHDLHDDENKRGFVTGAVLKLWEVYHMEHQIDAGQFNTLVELVCSFDNGAYRDFIKSQVVMYEEGKPPIIIGY